MEHDGLKPPKKIVRDESTGWMIKTAASWIDKQLNVGLKSTGISRGQFAIMMVLLEEDGLTQVDIGRRIAMPGYATSRNIDDLEKRDFVKRLPHESSRRSHRIHITPQGKELAPCLFELVDNIGEQLHEVFDEKEVKTLNLLLSKLVMFITNK